MTVEAAFGHRDDFDRVARLNVLRHEVIERSRQHRGEQMSSDNETEIRQLIVKWAEAVHSGDLEGVLAAHAEDIVMFDVPPPEEGVRGIDAYRETWPPFFEWQRSGASFEIVSLTVTAGE